MMMPAMMTPAGAPASPAICSNAERMSTSSDLSLEQRTQSAGQQRNRGDDNHDETLTGARVRDGVIK